MASEVGTVGQTWQLTAGNNTNPALTALTPTKWDFNDLPDRSPTGPLAYYLPYVLLTIQGTYGAGAEAGVIQRDQLPFCLIQSIDWVNAWHGTPVSANHVLGQHLQVVSFVGGGYQHAERQINALDDTTTSFEMTVAIPACSRLGNLSRDTAQLALLFQSSNLKLNVPALTGAGSPVAQVTGVAGSGFSNLTAKLTAYLEPRQELICATPVEWILHQVVAGVNSPAIKITGFGRDTMLTGVESKGGVIFAGEYTSKNFQGGLFAASEVLQFSFPWRGQQQTDDIKAIVDTHLQALPNDRPQVAGSNVQAAGDINDYQGFPYSYDASGAANGNSGLPDLLIFPLVTGGNALRLTDLQTADSDQTYFLTVSGGFDAGDHLIPAQYARVFTAAKRADWVSQVRKAGLDTYVLGKDAAGADLYRRFPRDKHVLTEDQQTYLSWQYVRAPLVQAAR